MAPVMRGHNQQPRSDGEAKESNEWVAKANPIEVKAGAFSNDRSHLLLRVKKCPQSFLLAYPRCRNDLLWSPEFSFRRRLKCTDEKAAEPRRFNRRATGFSKRSPALHRSEQRGDIHGLRPGQMIEALGNT